MGRRQVWRFVCGGLAGLLAGAFTVEAESLTVVVAHPAYAYRCRVRAPRLFRTSRYPLPVRRFSEGWWYAGSMLVYPACHPVAATEAMAEPVSAPEPLVVRNPYATDEPIVAPTLQPLRIRNPYAAALEEDPQPDVSPVPEALSSEAPPVDEARVEEPHAEPSPSDELVPIAEDEEAAGEMPEDASPDWNGEDPVEASEAEDLPETSDADEVA